MVNRNRGETALVLQEKTYTLVPSFQVLASIEGELNCSILDLIAKISQGQFLQLKEIEVIIRHAISQQIEEDLRELIYKVGVVVIFPQIVVFLKNALNIEE